jgi:hypothetical protein
MESMQLRKLQLEEDEMAEVLNSTMPIRKTLDISDFHSEDFSSDYSCYSIDTENLTSRSKHANPTPPKHAKNRSIGF